MKSDEFRVLLAVAGRLARAELKDRPQEAGQKPKWESTEYFLIHSALSTQH